MFRYIIVDDESVIRSGIKKMLEPLSDQLSFTGEAANGRDAISLIESSAPDIAIIDMQMPIMSGTQLLPYLTENYPGLQLIVISGYKDFDYIKTAMSANAIDYVLKPFSRNQMQETVLKAMEKLNNAATINRQITSSEKAKEQAYYEYDIQMLRNLVLGNPVDSADISSSQLGFLTAQEGLFLITFNATNPLDGTDVQAYLDDSGFHGIALYLAHLNNLYQGFVLLSVPAPSIPRSRELCCQIMQGLSALLNDNKVYVRFGISGMHNSLDQLPAAYDETCTALNTLLLHDSQHYYFFYEGEKDFLQITWEKKDEFLFRLESGMADQVRGLLYDLKSFCLSIPSLTLGDVKYYLYSLTNQCWPIMNYYSKQYKPSISMQNIVKSIFSLEELIEYYQVFFANLTTVLNNNNVYAVDDVIEKARIYIERNYQKNLTTELMSCYFYLNPDYFSHLFRKKTGQKFVDYVNSVRIEKSKEMLASTDRKMYQIAKSVGYDNVKYFFRVFKKREGMTPEQYRLKNWAGLAK